MLAQAVIDCWAQGKAEGSNIQCCYVIDPSELKEPVKKADVVTALKRNPGGRTLAGDVQWAVGEERIALISSSADAIVCFDYNVLDNEVYITYDPISDCD